MRNLDSRGERRSAQDVFHQMVNCNIAPNNAQPAYDFHIRVCNRLRDYHSALKAAEDLKESKAIPGIIFYSNLIETYANVQRLPELLEEIEASNLKKDAIFFAQCVRTCVTTGNHHVKRKRSFHEEIWNKHWNIITR